MSVKSYYQQVPLMFVTPYFLFPNPNPSPNMLCKFKHNKPCSCRILFLFFFPSQYKNAIIKLSFPCASSSFLLLLSCNDGESREMKVRLGWVDVEVHTHTHSHLRTFKLTQIHPQLRDKSASAGYWLVYSYFTYKPTFTNSHSDSDLMIIVMASDHPSPLLTPCTQGNHGCSSSFSVKFDGGKKWRFSWWLRNAPKWLVWMTRFLEWELH